MQSRSNYRMAAMVDYVNDSDVYISHGIPPYQYAIKTREYALTGTDRY
jgi:hypothetical protein